MKKSFEMKSLNPRPLIFISLFFLSFSLYARPFGGDIDWIGNAPLKQVSSTLSPDKKETLPLRNPAHLAARFYIQKSGKLKEVIPFEVFIKSEGKKLITNGKSIHFNTCQNNKLSELKAVFKLETPFFIVKQRKTYQIKLNLTCGHINTFIFNNESHSGQALNIFNIANKARVKMKKNNILSFWKKKINIVYPGRGDYYSYGTVHITKGHFWDVVGHEIGHALYDMANIGVMEGGPHRIDECYSKGLALSEGWASFFSAWLSVDLKDPDAKFEYMVPRRAPLQFENIPSDVCPGEKNEWRVTGFLWDLVDIHEDFEDTLKIPFKTFWNFTLKKGFRSSSSLYKSMIKKGFPPELLKLVWEQNFLGPPKNVSI